MAERLSTANCQTGLHADVAPLESLDAIRQNAVPTGSSASGLADCVPSTRRSQRTSLHDRHKPGAEFRAPNLEAPNAVVSRTHRRRRQGRKLPKHTSSRHVRVRRTRVRDIPLQHETTIGGTVLNTPERTSIQTAPRDCIGRCNPTHRYVSIAPPSSTLPSNACTRRPHAYECSAPMLHGRVAASPLQPHGLHSLRVSLRASSSQSPANPAPRARTRPYAPPPPGSIPRSSSTRTAPARCRPWKSE